MFGLPSKKKNGGEVGRFPGEVGKEKKSWTKWAMIGGVVIAFVLYGGYELYNLNKYYNLKVVDKAEADDVQEVERKGLIEFEVGKRRHDKKKEDPIIVAVIDKFDSSKSMKETEYFKQNSDRFIIDSGEKFKGNKFVQKKKDRQNKEISTHGIDVIKTIEAQIPEDATNIKIMPIQINGDYGTAKAITDAVNNGADLVNVSLGNGYTPHQVFKEEVSEIKIREADLAIFLTYLRDLQITVKTSIEDGEFSESESSSFWKRREGVITLSSRIYSDKIRNNLNDLLGLYESLIDEKGEKVNKEFGKLLVATYQNNERKKYCKTLLERIEEKERYLINLIYSGGTKYAEDVSKLEDKNIKELKEIFEEEGFETDIDEKVRDYMVWSKVKREAVNYAKSKNVPVVFSAGNEGVSIASEIAGDDYKINGFTVCGVDQDENGFWMKNSDSDYVCAVSAPFEVNIDGNEKKGTSFSAAVVSGAIGSSMVNVPPGGDIKILIDPNFNDSDYKNKLGSGVVPPTKNPIL